jgi:hypothetical protein
VVIGLVGAADASAARKKTLRIFRPGPGNVTVQVVSVRVTGSHLSRLPKRLGLKFIRPASIPSSVRILTAQRTVRTRKAVRYGLMIVSVERAAPKARAAQRPPDAAEETSLLFAGKGQKGRCLDNVATFCLFMGAPVAADFIVEDDLAYENAQEERLNRKTQAYVMDAIYANKAAAEKTAQKVGDLFGGLPENGGLTFEKPKGQLDPQIDTGHYDDGHAFGWKINTKAEEHSAWGDLLRKTVDQDFRDMLAVLETHGGTDLNGNGVIESPGQTIDTTIGEPQIM